MKVNEHKCPECGILLTYLLSREMDEGEIIGCPCCGADLTLNSDGNLVVLQIEGEDWGE